MSSFKSLAFKIPSFRASPITDETTASPSHLFSLKRDAIHALQIMSNLNEQRKNASHYCDLQITTSDQIDLWAHKVIMDVFTKYFDEPGRYTLERIDARTMEGFLNFIYTGVEPNLDAENTLKVMTSSLELGIHQVFRVALTYCMDNIFEVLHADYFCSLSFEELSVLPIFEEGLLLDKLQESKYRRIIHKWLSVEPTRRLEYRKSIENLFSKLWTLEDHERALAIAVNEQGLANFVQLNYQDLRWYPCEFSCKLENLIDTSLTKVLQMGLYKTDHFVFRDTSNNVYYASTQLKRIWNKSSTLGTFVASHCIALKQLDGQIYALFDCFKKWNGESKKFETVISKEVFQKLELTVKDFTIDDKNSNIYFLTSAQDDATSTGIFTYVANVDNLTVATFDGVENSTTLLTASDDQLLVYGDTVADDEMLESDVYTYQISRKSFNQETFMKKTFDSKGSLFRMNNKIYSLSSLAGEEGKQQVKTFPLKYEEEKVGLMNGERELFVTAVCVCPRKAYHDAVYGHTPKTRLIST